MVRVCWRVAERTVISDQRFCKSANGGSKVSHVKDILKSEEMISPDNYDAAMRSSTFRVIIIEPAQYRS